MKDDLALAIIAAVACVLGAVPGAGLAFARNRSVFPASGCPVVYAVAAAQSYERWLRPPEPWPLERRTGRAVKSWAARKGLHLEDDARLAIVARSALPDVPHQTGARLDIDGIRAHAHRLGWTDGELAAIAMRLPEAANLETALAAELEERLVALAPNRIGVAARLDAGERAILVLFSRRLVRLWPVPARLAPGGHTTIAGAVLLGSGERLVSLTLVLGLPGGAVRRRALTTAQSAFEAPLDAGPTAGVLSVQLLLDRGRGPEIAAQFPIGVGQAAVEPVPSLPSTDEGAGGYTVVTNGHATGDGSPGSDALDDGELGRRLAALVLGSREAADLALPAASTVLDEVARAHARDMQQAGYFAHVSPRYGDLSRRLAGRGIVVSRALENLARASNVDEVLRQWLASPAHRANLLDPDVDAFGVGVQAAPSGDILAVLVLARRADAGDTQELAARILTRINAERLRRGLATLEWDEELARLAAARSHSSARGDNRDRAVGEPSELGLDDVAAELFVSPTIDAVTKSRLATASFDRAGVGVVRGDSGDPRLWITVVYAID